MKSNRRRAIYSSLAVGIGAATLSVLPWMLALDQNLGLAWLFALRGTEPAPESVVVVVLSAESAEVLGGSTDLDEWPRERHARVIERLGAAGATVIALDISFEEPGDAAPDEALARAIEGAGNVVLLARVAGIEWGLSDSGAPGPDPRDLRRRLVSGIERSALATAPFTLPRVPIRVDQFWVFGSRGSDVAQLPFVTLQVHVIDRYERLFELLERHRPALADRLPPTRAALEQGDLELTIRDIRRAFLADTALREDLLAALDAAPADDATAALRTLIDAYGGSASRYLNYRGVSGTIDTLAYHVVLEMPEQALRDAVAGRAVFLGYAERDAPEQQEDEFVTVYSESTGISLSGVEIGATAFANLLAGTSIRPLSIPAQWLFVLLWGAGLMLLVARLGVRSAILTGLVAAVAYVAAATFVFESAQSWWPLVVPVCVQVPLIVAAQAWFRFADINAQRERIQIALGRYMPGHAVERLADDTFDARADTDLVYGTCLITDVEQYTGVAESMSPAGLAELLRSYFALLSARVEQSGGYVADVSGDSMVAIWAAAMPDVELRRKACEGALGILADVARFNQGAGPSALPTGVGLDSGQVMLGDIGARDRHRFRAVGDIVNTASRIQGLNRKLGTEALLSETTLVGLDRIATRRVGEFLLVGKRSPVVVHELLGLDGEHGSRADWLDAFAAGLRSFAKRDWAAARGRFEDVLRLHADDGPSRFYIGQCELFAARELPEDWSGMIHMTVK